MLTYYHDRSSEENTVFRRARHLTTIFVEEATAATRSEHTTLPYKFRHTVTLLIHLSGPPWWSYGEL